MQADLKIRTRLRLAHTEDIIETHYSSQRVVIAVADITVILLSREAA